MLEKFAPVNTALNRSRPSKSQPDASTPIPPLGNVQGSADVAGVVLPSTKPRDTNAEMMLNFEVFFMSYLSLNLSLGAWPNKGHYESLSYIILKFDTSA